jgi:NAD(P)-dependent dehydrogenase (short-subunit alcohol dehydrogenase family)
VRPLDGRVALVTGAGRGIGRAHALHLARDGAAVVVNDRGTDIGGHGHDAAPAHDVAREITAAGGRAIADLRDIASIAGGSAAVEATVATFGRIDVVVNNAGFALGGGTIVSPIEGEIDALFAVHVRAALGTMSAAIPHMRAQRYGRIVNTVSEVALDARFTGAPAYGMAKAALWSATLAAAAEVATFGITVNAISPGARTRMNADVLDAGFRAGASTDLDLAPEHVAHVVAWLASPDAGDVTGRVIHAAGGMWREYRTRRDADTALVARLREALAPRPSASGERGDDGRERS